MFSCCRAGSQVGEAQDYAESDKAGMDKAFASDQEKMISRIVESVCRTPSDIKHTNEDGPLEVKHSSSFGQTLFRGVMQQVWNSQELALCKAG